jgi:hypothetical protein
MGSLTDGEDGFIIILDVLGTRGFWLRTDPKIALQNFSQIVDTLYLWKSRFEKTLEMRKINLNMSIYHFSDTIMICFVPDSANKLDDIVKSSLLISSVIICGIDLGILLRGTISFGKFYRKREEKYSFIIGPAVDEAAEWYDKAQMIGAFCSPSLCFGLDAYDQKNKLGAEYFVKYPVELKDKPPFETWVINWPVMISSYLGETPDQGSYIDKRDSVIRNKKWVLDKFSNLSIGTNDFNKFENTMTFYEKVVTALDKAREND